MHYGIRKGNKPAGLFSPISGTGRLNGMNDTGIEHEPVHAANLIEHARAFGERVPGMTLRRKRHSLAVGGLRL
jgi:hypothetical protein